MKSVSTHQKGHSLAEIAGVLIIVVILTAGFFSLYTKAVSKAQANSHNNISYFEYMPNITFGPYMAKQIFFNKDQSITFLGEKCANNLSCNRTFCGQFEIKNKNEVYIHMKDLNHCISNMAKY